MNDTKIRLLGRLQISDGQERPLQIAMRKEEALLAYLAVEHHYTHSRESLVGLFWPDLPASTARLNLRVTLSRLKKKLDDVDKESLFYTTKNDIRFMANRCWLDVVAFTQALHSREGHDHRRDEVCDRCRADVAGAVELYRSTFLDGLFLDGCQLFDEWLFMQREHLRTQVMGALTGLIHLHQRHGDSEEALHFARRQLEIDPLHEEAHRVIMQLHLAQGRRSEALRQYEICRTQLHTELGVEPSAEIMEIYQQLLSAVVHPAPTLPPAVTGPAVTGPAAPANLPCFLTPFIGRQDELALLHERLDSNAYRLITLMGAGGMGKTRLAVEAAQQQHERFPDGVYFVPLAGVQNPEAVLDTLAATLRVTFRAGERTAQQQLFDWLRPRRLLLLLDNMEHLLGAALTLVEILQAAPQVKILVTSREPLGVQAEDQVVVTGLEVPTTDYLATADHYPSVRLFVDRAYRVNKRFRLQAENVTDVVRICRMVEGRPLGIELAAVHTVVQSCGAIADAIAADLDFLAVDIPDLPARHRSLRAVFEQSWQMLTPAEQSVFARLSIFRNPFTLEAALAVAGASLPILTRLSNGHLIDFHEIEDDGQRFRIHELLRQFAAEKLARMLPDRSVLERRYVDYFLTWLSGQTPILAGVRPKQSVGAIQAVIDDVRMAWQWASAAQSTALLARALPVLTGFYMQQGMHAACTHSLQGTLADIPHDAEALRAQLLPRLAASLQRQGKGSASWAVAKEGLDLALRLDDRESAALSRLIMARLASFSNSVVDARRIVSEGLAELPAGMALALRIDMLILKGVMEGELGNQAAAAEDYAEAHRLVTQTGNKVQEQRLLIYRGLNLADKDEVQARRWIEQALALCPETGDRTLESRIYDALGYVLARIGRYEEAIDYQQRGLDICRADQEAIQQNHALHNLCCNHYALGDYEKAYAYGKEALEIAEHNHLVEGIGYAQLHLGHVLAEMRRHSEAKQALLSAKNAFDQLELKTYGIETDAGLAYVEYLMGNLPAARAHVDTIYANLMPTPVVGFDQPGRVYLHCYYVLTACKDDRAQDVLNAAYRYIQSRALHLDAADREFLFTAVPAHRAILAASGRMRD